MTNWNFIKSLFQILMTPSNVLTLSNAVCDMLCWNVLQYSTVIHTDIHYPNRMISWLHTLRMEKAMMTLQYIHGPVFRYCLHGHGTTVLLWCYRPNLGRTDTGLMHVNVVYSSCQRGTQNVSAMLNPNGTSSNGLFVSSTSQNADLPWYLVWYFLKRMCAWLCSLNLVIS